MELHGVKNEKVVENVLLQILQLNLRSSFLLIQYVQGYVEEMYLVNQWGSKEKEQMVSKHLNQS